MTYLSDRKHSRRNRFYYIFLFILFCLVVYFWPDFRKLVYPKTEQAVISYGSVKNGFFSIPSSLYTYFSSKNALVSKNNALELNIERLENEIAAKDAILREKDLLDDSGSLSSHSTIIMYPIMKDITTIYSTVLLGKGFKDGVSEQKNIFIRGRQAVCFISDVYNSTSLCKLFSASGVETEGVTSSSTTLYLKGNGGGTFIAEIPIGTDVFLGQKVLLKSDESMTLGNVSQIIPNAQSSTLYVFVRGFYSPVKSNVFYMDK